MDVKTLLEEKALNHKSQGSDYLVQCLSPDHEDSNPSMRIDKISGVFHCFSCGFKGDIFKHFGMRVGVVDRKSAEVKKKIDSLLQNVNLNLPVDLRPYNKLHRGISKETYEHFEAFTTSTLDMQDRIVFPIRNTGGNIKFFLGRWEFSDAKPKYLVRPRNTTVFPYPTMPDIRNGSVVLVEGIWDMLNLYDKGLKNVMCTFGTATLKSDPSKLDYLEIFGVNKLYIMFDGDEAGQRAGTELEKLLGHRFSTEQILLPEGVDPGILSTEDIENLIDIINR